MTTKIFLDPATGQTRTATYSDTEQHRYTLRVPFCTNARRWLMVIGLNPSTATERINDSTVTRCLKRAEALGFDGLVMTNLFAYRSTDRAILGRLAPGLAEGGVDQMEALKRTADEAELILCAWGNDGARFRQAAIVLRALSAHRAKFRCLAITNLGHPKHPLYCRNNAPLLPFNP